MSYSLTPLNVNHFIFPTFAEKKEAFRLLK